MRRTSRSLFQEIEYRVPDVMNVIVKCVISYSAVTYGSTKRWLRPPESKKKDQEKMSSPGLRMFYAASLGPGRTNRLAHQQRRVGALPRDELLRTAAPHLCRVEVPVLVHAELVRSPQSARLGGHRAPRIQQLPIQVEFVELEIPVTVRRPEVLVRGHEDVIRRGGAVAEVPLSEELAVLIEDLNAPVASVVDVEPALVVDRDAVHGIEVVWPHLLAAGLAPLAPRHQELAVLVKFHDARFLVPIGDEEGAVRQPRDVGLTAEGLAGRTGLLDVRRARGIAGHSCVPFGRRVLRADGLEQF